MTRTQDLLHKVSQSILKTRFLLLVSHLCYKINRFFMTLKIWDKLLSFFQSKFFSLYMYNKLSIKNKQVLAQNCADLRVLSSTKLYQKSRSINALVQSFATSYVNWVRRCWGHKKLKIAGDKYTRSPLQRFTKSARNVFCCLSLTFF